MGCGVLGVGKAWMAVDTSAKIEFRQWALANPPCREPLPRKNLMTNKTIVRFKSKLIADGYCSVNC